MENLSKNTHACVFHKKHTHTHEETEFPNSIQDRVFTTVYCRKVLGKNACMVAKSSHEMPV